MNRRQFLALTTTAAAGYSVCVRADLSTSTLNPDRETIGTALDQLAPPEDRRRRLAEEPHLRLVDLESDVFIAGGGLAGVCAALAAARNGARVILVQDRSRLGGNASSEVRMHIVGADNHGSRPGWREGGLIEELRLEDAANNPHRAWELFDLMLYDKVIREPRITLLLDTTLYAADTRRRRIREVRARCDRSEHVYRIRSDLFIDCTGDSRLGLEADAEFRRGRESQAEFGESLALAEADEQTLGSSILFTAREHDRPMPFTPPPWARKVTKEMLQFRGVGSWEYGYWWIEWGGQLDTIRHHERIRFELLAIVLGVWDYIKNSGDQPTSANWALETVGMIPGKRESRRLVGDILLRQQDLQDHDRAFDDAVAMGGWNFDDHPPDGFDSWRERPFRSIPLPSVYPIPFRCLYSRNIVNLLMAGRNLSATHVAFSSSRVMATCAAAGQAAGTAAALCARHEVAPRGLYEDKKLLRLLQQTLLRDDQSIPGLRNTDPADLARRAVVTASQEHGASRAAHVLTGEVRDLPGQWRHRWAASLTEGDAWLDLAWTKPQRIGMVQITFDSGFQRELTLSASNTVNRRVVRGPQPETVRDYQFIGITADGEELLLADVRGNYQRLRRHLFAPATIARLRLRVTATHGAPIAAVYEVRCYEAPQGTH